MLPTELDMAALRSKIDTEGYVILKKIISPEDILEMQKYWLSKMYQGKKSSFMRGDIFFGEKNCLTYECSNDLCLYRYFEFFWNKSESDITRKHCVKMHKLRNLFLDVDEVDGLLMQENKFGLYISTSLYEVDKGMFFKHRDGHADQKIFHFMIPLTFKGKHYKDGGLYITNSKGVMDIDSLCQEGDVILFNGAFEHEVKLIKGGETGRLAVFAVPTYFIDGLGFNYYKVKYIKKFKKIVKNFLSFLDKNRKY
jgi:hypothetical protein